jgi:hypothetical protein
MVSWCLQAHLVQQVTLLPRQPVTASSHSSTMSS